jgi:hypothetical protein
VDIAVLRPVLASLAVIDPASLCGTAAGITIATAPHAYCSVGFNMLDTTCRNCSYAIAAR